MSKAAELFEVDLQQVLRDRVLAGEPLYLRSTLADLSSPQGRATQGQVAHMVKQLAQETQRPVRVIQVVDLPPLGD